MEEASQDVELAPTKSFTIEPYKESFTTSTGQTINGTAIITNDGDVALESFTYEFIPYSYELDTFYGSNEIELEEPWHHYNDIVNWAEITSSPVTNLAPGESAAINYSITIPSCSPSDFQWLALKVSSPESYVEIAELMEVKIENNEASECGGTADDPYPYVEIKYIDYDGNVATGLTKFDSEAVEEYEEEKEDIEAYEQAIGTATQTIGTVADNLPVIVGATAGAIALAALIIILVKVLTKKKSGPNPPAQTPPSQPETPETPPTPQAPTNPQH